MASMLSSVAAWMNEQVFTMMASALDASSVTEKPASRKRRAMAAESTSFFAHPIVMRQTEGTALSRVISITSVVLAIVDVLQRLPVVLAAQEGDDLLQRVAGGRAHAQLVALDRSPCT